MDKKKICRTALLIVLAVLILAVILPIIIGAGYTYPCEDDFSFEMGGKMSADTYGNILGALIGAYGYYVSWQGTYLSNILWYLIRPYDRAGILGYHLAMIGLVTLLIASVYFLIKVLVREQKSVLLLALVVYLTAFCTSGRCLEQEFLYWYTGVINYTLVFSLACITLALTVLLKNEEQKKRRVCLAIAASVIGFLASGGSLEVTSFNCSWLLLMLVLCYDEVLKNKILLCPFLASFIGALFNAGAPGNFARSELINADLDYGIIDALRDTYNCWETEWNVIWGNKLFLFLLLTAFIVCLICKVRIFKKGISTWQMLVILPASFLIQYFTAFPVVLGYQTSRLIYSRTIYTYELSAKLIILFLIIVFAQWVKEHIRFSVFFPTGIALIAATVILINYNIADIYKQGYLYNVSKELCNGKIQELYKFRKDVLELLEESEAGTDVYLKVPGIPESNVMYGMGLTEDPDCTCNSHAAEYYGFKSLAVEYSDEYYQSN